MLGRAAFGPIFSLLLLSADPVALVDIDRLFGYGADHANEGQALNLLERALIENPSDYQLLWRAARSYYYTGDGVEAKEKLSYYERGIAVGERAVAQDPNAVDGHFWLAANYGGFCREKGGLTAFRMVKKVRAEMESVLRLNDRYEEGSAYLALGEIDRQVPGFFGGDDKRGIARLEQGLKVVPSSPELKFSLAEAYFDAKRKAEARREIEELLKIPLTSPRANEGRRAQEKARQLLKKLEQK